MLRPMRNRSTYVLSSIFTVRANVLLYTAGWLVDWLVGAKFHKNVFQTTNFDWKKEQCIQSENKQKTQYI